MADLLVLLKICQSNIIDAKEDKCVVAKIAHDIREETEKTDTPWYEVILDEESLEEGVSDTLMYFYSKFKLPNLVSNFNG